MNYDNFTTFNVETENAIAWVTFDYPPVNIQGKAMLDELNNLAEQLEGDRSIKVVVFQSAHPEIFIAHYDIELLKDMSTVAVPRDEVETSYLQNVLERISKLPQATIAKIEGFARGGGHEFALACDMRCLDARSLASCADAGSHRFAARGKAKFMQMEVGMGILPCGGGASRMARQVGLGKALEIILGARDFDADEAEAYGTINKALDADKIGSYVEALAERISKFPADSIEACKRAVYASIDLPIESALEEEEFGLYQATSKTPAIERFTMAYDTDFQNIIDNQRKFETLLMDLQSIE